VERRHAAAGHFALAVESVDLEHWRAWLRELGILVESEVLWERGGTSPYFRHATTTSWNS
jgi:hypothetical protein